MVKENIKEEILQALKGSEKSAYRIAKELNVSWPTARFHLKEFEAKGIIGSRKKFKEEKGYWCRVYFLKNGKDKKEREKH